MTPGERRQRELAAIFEAGRKAAADFPPLSDEQIEQVAFIIRPRLAASRGPAPAALPQAA